MLVGPAWMSGGRPGPPDIVVELKGSEVGIGDEIVGNLGIRGDVDLFNRTRRDRINGFVRDNGLAREDAIRALKSADSQMSQG